MFRRRSHRYDSNRSYNSGLSTPAAAAAAASVTRKDSARLSSSAAAEALRRHSLDQSGAQAIGNFNAAEARGGSSGPRRTASLTAAQSQQYSRALQHGGPTLRASPSFGRSNSLRGGPPSLRGAPQQAPSDRTNSLTRRNSLTTHTTVNRDYSGRTMSLTTTTVRQLGSFQLVSTRETPVGANSRAGPRAVSSHGSLRQQYRKPQYADSINSFDSELASVSEEPEMRRSPNTGAQRRQNPPSRAHQGARNSYVPAYSPAYSPASPQTPQDSPERGAAGPAPDASHALAQVTNAGDLTAVDEADETEDFDTSVASARALEKQLRLDHLADDSFSQLDPPFTGPVPTPVVQERSSSRRQGSARQSSLPTSPEPSRENSRKHADPVDLGSGPKYDANEQEYGAGDHGQTPIHSNPTDQPAHAGYTDQYSDPTGHADQYNSGYEPQSQPSQPSQLSQLSQPSQSSEPSEPSQYTDQYGHHNDYAGEYAEYGQHSEVPEISHDRAPDAIPASSITDPSTHDPSDTYSNKGFDSGVVLPAEIVSEPSSLGPSVSPGSQYSDVVSPPTETAEPPAVVSETVIVSEAPLSEVLAPVQAPVSQAPVSQAPVSQAPDAEALNPVTTEDSEVTESHEFADAPDDAPGSSRDADSRVNGDAAGLLGLAPPGAYDADGDSFASASRSRSLSPMKPALRDRGNSDVSERRGRGGVSFGPVDKTEEYVYEGYEYSSEEEEPDERARALAAATVAASAARGRQPAGGQKGLPSSGSLSSNGLPAATAHSAQAGAARASASQTPASTRIGPAPPTQGSRRPKPGSGGIRSSGSSAGVVGGAAYAAALKAAPKDEPQESDTESVYDDADDELPDVRASREHKEARRQREQLSLGLVHAQRQATAKRMSLTQGDRRASLQSPPPQQQQQQQPQHAQAPHAQHAPPAQQAQPPAQHLQPYQQHPQPQFHSYPQRHAPPRQQQGRSPVPPSGAQFDAPERRQSLQKSASFAGPGKQQGAYPTVRALPKTQPQAQQQPQQAQQQPQQPDRNGQAAPRRSAMRPASTIGAGPSANGGDTRTLRRQQPESPGSASSSAPSGVPSNGHAALGRQTSISESYDGSLDGHHYRALVDDNASIASDSSFKRERPRSQAPHRLLSLRNDGGGQDARTRRQSLTKQGGQDAADFGQPALPSSASGTGFRSYSLRGQQAPDPAKLMADARRNERSERIAPPGFKTLRGSSSMEAPRAARREQPAPAAAPKQSRTGGKFRSRFADSDSEDEGSYVPSHSRRHSDNGAGRGGILHIFSPTTDAKTLFRPNDHDGQQRNASAPVGEPKKKGFFKRMFKR